MIRRFATLSLFALLATAVFAQTPTKTHADDTGWTSTVNFEGSADSQQRVLDLGSSVGYNFNEHWGADIGVPLSFVSSSTTTTTGTPTTKKSSSLNSLGNVYLDVNYKTTGDFANYNSTLTATAPSGSTSKGVSTGRPNFGWNNHVEHGFDPLTPFMEFGVSNGLTDTKFFHRPFTTLGFVSQLTGGSTIDLGHNFSVGGSLYAVLPAGQQKMFSKLVAKKSTSTAGTGKDGRAYELAAESTGDASLTKDHGGSAWIEFSPGKIFDFQIGYTHSGHFALNTVAFDLGINLGKLMKRADRY